MTKIKTADIREHYDTQIEARYAGDYEYNRWFRKARTWIDYQMMYKAIKLHLKDISFDSCFELGPGPGTWTKLLFMHNPTAKFTLLDISKEMKEQFRLEMRDADNVEYVVDDFLEYKTKENSHDLFFSSRALEYLPDQKTAVEKIERLLKPGGTCIVITKNPEQKTFRKSKTKKIHMGQISANDLKDIFTSYGFQSIQIFPVIVRLPLIDRVSFKFSEMVFNRTYRKNVEELPFYAESYCLLCRKK